MKKKSAFNLNSDEIKYELINSAIAGALIFLGSLTNGFSWSGVSYGIIAGFIVMLTKFEKYWTTQKKEYKRTVTLFNFF